MDLFKTLSHKRLRRISSFVLLGFVVVLTHLDSYSFNVDSSMRKTIIEDIVDMNRFSNGSILGNNTEDDIKIESMGKRVLPCQLQVEIWTYRVRLKYSLSSRGQDDRHDEEFVVELAHVYRDIFRVNGLLFSQELELLRIIKLHDGLKFSGLKNIVHVLYPKSSKSLIRKTLNNLRLYMRKNKSWRFYNSLSSRCKILEISYSEPSIYSISGMGVMLRH